LCRIFLVIAVVLMTVATGDLAHADDFETRFEQSNKLYEEGKFSGAADGYDKLLATGRASAAVYFNRGNALLKSGQMGKAIASYREARRLAPRDAEVRANLQDARTLAMGGIPFHESRWHKWLSHLSLNEWTLLTMAAGWALLALVAVGQWRPEWRARFRNPLLASASALLLFGAGLVIEASDYYATTAIVTASEADVRNGPLEESASAFKVRDGMELDVIDRKDDWLQVMDSTQRMGWIKKDQVMLLGGSEKS
jgi:tetratricopeptide (TPR) repeat protein